MFDIFFDYLGQLLDFLFIWSNIGLSIMFFLLANHLINASQNFELKQDNLKLRIKKIDIKCKYGVLVLGLLSVFSLFYIFQSMLSFFFNIFPYSPFFEIMSRFGLLYQELYGYKEYQLIILGTAAVSLLSLILSIIGLYSAIFKKLIQGEKTKGFLYFIGFFALAFFFGLPLMLSYISPTL